jgi:hypothetical protein
MAGLIWLMEILLSFNDKNNKNNWKDKNTAQIVCNNNLRLFCGLRKQN